MTEEMERIGKILVEAEGGVWKYCDCLAVQNEGHCSITDSNPDFSEWQHFGWVLLLIDVLKIPFKLFRHECIRSEKVFVIIVNEGTPIPARHDQLPALVATELARVIEEGK